MISLRSQCGGTAISKHKILTAAHCCINQYSVIAIFNDQIAGLTEVDEFSIESKESFVIISNRYKIFKHFLLIET